MRYDVVIIGSGLGGLECGVILSKSSKHVLLLEREQQLGGCMQSYRRKGHAYDTGLHYVGALAEGQSLHGVFNYLGLMNLPWQRLDADGFDQVTIGSHTYSFAEGYEVFAEQLAKDFPAEREALYSYTQLLKKTEDEEYTFLRPDGVFDKEFSAFLQNTNAYDYLHQTFHDERLINVLSGTSLKMELNKSTLPLFTFAHGNSGFMGSSWRLKGDGNQLVESLTNTIRQNGGEVVCGAEVQELIEKNGRITAAVCKDGSIVEGDIFISDVHPLITTQWVKESQFVKKVYRRRMSQLENTFGMLTVSLCLKDAALPYFNHNKFVYKTDNVWTFYENTASIDGLMISCRVPEQSDYTRQIDLLTPMMWNQCEAWADTNIGRRGEEYLRMKEQLAEECICLAERVIPGLHEMVEESYVSTPLTYRDYTLTPEGSAYGIRKDYQNPMMTILSPRTPIPNLLLTGQNLMMHGIQGVTATSLFTCAEILGKEKIWNIIQI